MVKVIGVKFKTSSRVYYFDPLDLDFHAGDGVVVETSRGIEYGLVTCDPKEVEESEIVAPLKPVVRIATEEDKQMRDLYASKEPEAFALCEEKIQEHSLDMKLVDAEYIFNGSKIVFYFTADERVDFRELVKDLAYALHTRIELRQIGVRDEAKMLGGLGPCGRNVCCNAFLDDFRPVSIKMAKEQNLSLSPTKISGLCGRLMCCLQYEQNVYDSMKKVMPKVGKEVNTKDGVGVVVENNAITEKTKVRLTMEDGSIDIREYPYTHLGAVGEPLPKMAMDEPKKEDALEKGEEASDTETVPLKNEKRGGKPQQGKDAEKKKEGQKQKQPVKPAKKDNEAGKQENKPANQKQNEQRRGEGKQESSQHHERKPNKPAGERPKKNNKDQGKPDQRIEKPVNDSDPSETPVKKNNRRRHRNRKSQSPKQQQTNE